jgi:Zn-finger nucleic acid-binding protein
MKCPACGSELVEHAFGSAHVAVCENGCDGIWFDWSELPRLDDRQEGFRTALRRALGQPEHAMERRLQLVCPRCGTPMRAYQHGYASHIDIDECHGCGGFFLDSGELGTLRDTYMPEAERREYAERLAQEVPRFRSTLEKLQEQSQESKFGAGHAQQSAIESLLGILRLI